MKLVHPDINILFDTDIQKINTIIIENSPFYYSLVSQLHDQINGLEGKYVLSDNNMPIAINKHMEMISTFVPFEINRKPLLTKLAAALEKTSAVEYYEETYELIGRIEAFMNKLAFGNTGDIVFSKLSVGSLIKSVCPQFGKEQESLAENMLDYMELVREYEGKKLFITVNMRSFIGCRDAELFMESVVMHGYQLIMLENYAYPLCEHEKRIIIDSDLCEIT